MEWDSKTCVWNDKTKLEIQENNFQHHLASLAGSNGSGLTNMYSVDLKLGRLEDTGGVSLKNSMPFNMSFSSSASPVLGLSKRGRPRCSGAAQSNVFYSVDGCSSDLNLCREYHRRHKVCERHSKTPVVLIGGKEQRFCQQCSRFQSLEEFDEAKRSCRKRLDGHNRRRRKKQPETCYMPDSAGGFLSSHTGAGMLQFFCPQMNTGNWAAMPQPDMCFRNNQETIYQPPVHGLAPTDYRKGGLKEFSPRDSGCALSLLSRYPSQSSGISVGPPAMQPTTMSLSSVQGSSTDLNLNSNLVQVSYSQGLEYMESSSSLSSSTNANAQSFGGFRSGDDGFRESGLSSKIFPFCWE